MNYMAFIVVVIPRDWKEAKQDPIRMPVGRIEQYHTHTCVVNGYKLVLVPVSVPVVIKLYPYPYPMGTRVPDG
jgi:hypothetical protein